MKSFNLNKIQFKSLIQFELFIQFQLLIQTELNRTFFNKLKQNN